MLFLLLEKHLVLLPRILRDEASTCNRPPHTLSVIIGFQNSSNQ